MASNYYRCPVCGLLELVHYKAADVGALGWPPRCTRRREHPGSVAVAMELAPQPGDYAMDVGGVKGAAFQKFDVDVDGVPTTIDSLHTLRRVERESEQRYRNGEGAPLRFRMWNNDRTNKDVNSFGNQGQIGERTYEGAPDAPPKKSGKVSVKRHGEVAPPVTLGPGMKRAASGLPK